MRKGEFYRHNRTQQISRVLAVKLKTRRLAVAYLGGGIAIGLDLDAFKKDHTKMSAAEIAEAARSVGS